MPCFFFSPMCKMSNNLESVDASDTEVATDDIPLVNANLRGHPAVQKHCRAPRTIFAIKVCNVFHSQPMTHGPVGYWSPSTLSGRQMKLISPCLAVHHHIHHSVRSLPSPREERFCIVI